MYTIIHAIFGYLFLLLTVRVLSRRPGGQLTPFEFVIVFLIGGVIILSTTGNDRSLTNTVCAVLTIGLMHRLISWLKQRHRILGTWIDGTPLVLVKDGQWQNEVMAGMRIQDTDVMASGAFEGCSDTGLHPVRDTRAKRRHHRYESAR